MFSLFAHHWDTAEFPEYEQVAQIWALFVGPFFVWTCPRPLVSELVIFSHRICEGPYPLFPGHIRCAKRRADSVHNSAVESFHQPVLLRALWNDWDVIDAHVAEHFSVNFDMYLPDLSDMSQSGGCSYASVKMFWMPVSTVWRTGGISNHFGRRFPNVFRPDRHSVDVAAESR